MAGSQSPFKYKETCVRLRKLSGNGTRAGVQGNRVREQVISSREGAGGLSVGSSLAGRRERPRGGPPAQHGLSFAS